MVHLSGTTVTTSGMCAVCPITASKHQPRQSIDSCTLASLQLDQETDASVITQSLVLKDVYGIRDIRTQVTFC
jgi:hypothetical protein